ncbi:MAG: transposase [Gemmatimonadales bacterium]|nr:transposase [Gemmatimonadales bacterium]
MKLKAIPDNFLKLFGTKEACFEQLSSIKWPKGFTCLECDREESRMRAGRNLVRCIECRKEISITSGTLIHHTHIPIQKMVLALFIASHGPDPISPRDLLDYGVTGRYGTAWKLCSRIRDLMKRAESSCLGGAIEADAKNTEFRSFVKGDKYKVSIVGAVELAETIEVFSPSGSKEMTGRIRLASARSIDLIPFFLEAVEPGSIVCTRDAKEFSKLEDHSFTHSPEYKSTIHNADNSLVEIRRVMEMAKEWLPATLKYKKLDEYLDEYVFRHNQGHNQDLAFQKLLKTALAKKKFRRVGGQLGTHRFK